MERENSTNFISEDDLQPYKTCFDESPAAFCVIDVLQDAGFGARRNSRGLLVEVVAGDKGRALGELADAGIGVVDVDVWR